MNGQYDTNMKYQVIAMKGATTSLPKTSPANSWIPRLDSILQC